MTLRLPAYAAALLSLGLVAAAPLTAAPAAAATHTVTPAAARWTERPTGTTAEFRGLDAYSASTAWVAGTHGTVLRTKDGGRRWIDVSPPGAGALEFRDVEVLGGGHAVVSSIGDKPTDFRFYVTRDAGRTWSRGFTNRDPKAFYDCMTFFDHDHGIAMSDPVDGRFRILSTSDGGSSWHVLPAAGMPKAQPGEAGFAASGTCLVSSGPTHAWLASGGGARTRVYRTADRGLHWQVSSTPVSSGASAGIYALAVRGLHRGLAVGGDYTKPTEAPRSLAVTADGGRSYALAADPPGEYRSGAAYRTDRTALVVGPTGSDVSTDGGRTWRGFDTGSLDAVSCAGGGCWGSGVDGRVTVYSGP